MWCACGLASQPLRQHPERHQRVDTRGKDRGPLKRLLALREYVGCDPMAHQRRRGATRQAFAKVPSDNDHFCEHTCGGPKPRYRVTTEALVLDLGESIRLCGLLRIMHNRLPQLQTKPHYQSRHCLPCPKPHHGHWRLLQNG